MRKKIKRTIHLSGYVFWALIVIAGLFVLIARPQLSAKLLVEEDGKIIAPVGEPVDLYYIIKNDGLTKAVVENVFI